MCLSLYIYIYSFKVASIMSAFSHHLRFSNNVFAGFTTINTLHILPACGCVWWMSPLPKSIWSRWHCMAIFRWRLPFCHLVLEMAHKSHGAKEMLALWNWHFKEPLEQQVINMDSLYILNTWGEKVPFIVILTFDVMYLLYDRSDEIDVESVRAIRHKITSSVYRFIVCGILVCASSFISW